jgi:MBG domain/Putative Ig domain/Abnormal spindle-like microcephaly-assoc'd, ASPM-SPD-2-Hydin/Galactose oxidase, central domain
MKAIARLLGWSTFSLPLLVLGLAPQLHAQGTSVSPSSINFGNQLVGTTSAAQMVTVKNTGTTAVTITSATAPAPFAVGANCNGRKLSANASCTFNVTFKPTASGAASATLTVAFASPVASQTVSLSGTGIEPVASVSPSSLTFPNQQAGTTSAPMPVTLTNTGTAALTINGIGIGGTNPANFSETNNCGSTFPATLAIGAQCTIQVSFMPNATTLRSANLNINVAKPATSQTVPLSGTGTAPSASLSPSTLSFGEEPVGGTSTAQAVTLSNTGPGPFTITGITIGGTNPGAFAETNNCGTLPATVAVSGTCTFSVTFKPGATGAKSASLSVAIRYTSAPLTVSLRGTGTATPIRPAITSANSTAFTVGVPGSFTVTATGSPTPTITESGALPTGVAFNSATGVLSGTPAQAGTFAITFTATSTAGTANQAFTLTVNKGNATVTLSNTMQMYTGAPLSPAVTTSPAGLAYSLSGAPDTNVGSYPVAATVTDPNYTGSASGSFIINQATPVFSNLTPSQISQGRASVNVSGTISAGSAYPPPGETVSITINSAAVAASIGANGVFSTAISTSSIPASNMPYTIAYSYAGDSNFAYATDTSTTLTVGVGVPTYTQITSANSPSPRCCLAMAFDPVSNSTLLVGGVIGYYSAVGDTWALQGGQWSQLFPGNAPSPREGAVMAYDVATNTVVLFGGTTTLFGGCCGDLNDTWVWNGATSTWTQVKANGDPNSPPPRRFDGQGMAYDPNTRSVVLFGGVSSGPSGQTVLGDTWTWNGVTQTWTNQNPVTSPDPDVAPIAYDAATGVVVLFNGSSGKTWTWNGSNWQQQFPASSPPAPRSLAAMAYDADLGEVVLFGGSNSPNFYTDTWAWDGNNWTQLSTSGGPPPDRYAFGMDYDSAAHAVVIFGGFSSGDIRPDTWELSVQPPAVSTYTQLPAPSPGTRCCMAMVFVPSDASGGANYTLVFGGGNSGGAFGDTWMYQNGTWTQLAPASFPPARSAPGLAYDALTKTVVLFGGNANGQDFNDTWIWNGTTWSQASPSNVPIGRRWDTQGMAQDPSGNVVMFGGIDAGGNTFDDTWIWDGTNWNLQNTPAGLAARRAPLVYDPATNSVVLFGGEGGYGGPTFGDTWVWNGANWTQQNPTTTPPARSMASMAYDSFMSRLVLFGGSQAGSGNPDYNDAWTWDGANWTQLSPAGGPPPVRYAFGMVYDPSAGVLIYGGLANQDSVFLSDMWSLAP